MTKVYIFNDAIVLKLGWNNTTLAEVVTKTKSGKILPLEQLLDTKNLFILRNPKEEMTEFFVPKVVNNKTGYSLVDESLPLEKEISIETYESLANSFKIKYKQNTLKETKLEPLEDYYGRANAKEIHRVDSDFVKLWNISDLEKPEYSLYSDHAGKDSFSEYEPIFIGGKDILKILAEKLKENKRLNIITDFYEGTYNYRRNKITIEYLEKEYKGEKKKIYSLKRNGQRYADGRGRYVKDLGKVLTTITLDYEETPSSIPSVKALNLKELDDMINVLVKKLSFKELK